MVVLPWQTPAVAQLTDSTLTTCAVLVTELAVVLETFTGTLMSTVPTGAPAEIKQREPKLVEPAPRHPSNVPPVAVTGPAMVIPAGKVSVTTVLTVVGPPVMVTAMV